MAILCMGCAIIGDLLGYRRRGKHVRTLLDYDERRIMEAALILNCVAFLASIWIQVVFREEIERSMHNPGAMSGPMTIAIFFAAVHRYGFALAMLIYWRRRTGMAPGHDLHRRGHLRQRNLFGTRRGPAMELIFITDPHLRHGPQETHPGRADHAFVRRRDLVEHGHQRIPNARRPDVFREAGIGLLPERLPDHARKQRWRNLQRLHGDGIRRRKRGV